MTDLENGDGGGPEGQRVLLSNLAAVRAVTEAVAGTLGPRGLDCLLVAENGETVLTNDGVTILRHLDAPHPAARLLIQAAEAQERAVGDGTTTATILAGALVTEGIEQILRGVPATRVVDGIRLGLVQAISALDRLRRPVSGLDDPALHAAVRNAARGDAGVAGAVLDAARHLGGPRLDEAGFSLSERVLGLDGAADGAYPGVIIEREPATPGGPSRLEGAVVLAIDGALEAEALPPEALSSAAGLTRAEAAKAAFGATLARLAESGPGLVLAGRGVAEEAARFLAERGIIALRRVAERDLRRAAALSGARPIVRLPGSTMEGILGRVAMVEYDPAAGLVRLAGGPGPPEATIVVGGATAEAVAERERIARDAAAALQQARRGGVVPGGGAAELALARALAGCNPGGMASYGVACLREAMRRPLAQLAANAGFNPLAKVEEAYAAQERMNSAGLGIDPETGEVADLAERGILDPHSVKESALRTAVEAATAILRIGNILKMRSGSGEEGWHDPA
ncbi:MAG: TCP-1/cpn60 chaperonin family protein [Bacteroidota bacterium]